MNERKIKLLVCTYKMVSSSTLFWISYNGVIDQVPNGPKSCTVDSYMHNIQRLMSVDNSLYKLNFPSNYFLIDC